MKRPSQLQQGTKLADQLDTYSASVRANHTARWWSKRIQRWAPYAAAVGSGLALTTATDAGIIYSGIQNVSVSDSFGARASSGQNKTIKLDPGVAVFGINIHFTSDFFGKRSGRTGATLAADRSLVTNAKGVLQNGSGQLKRLASGARISNGAGTFGAKGELVQGQRGFQASSPGHHGTWPISQTGFAGVEFKTGGGQTDFGWIRLEWNGNGNGYADKLTAIDWAYEDSGVPIATGDVGTELSTPEPSSLTLVLLATGSAGVLAWRKRRKQPAAAATAP